MSLGTFHAAAAAATPTVLSPTAAGMTTFPIHGAVTQPTMFSPNALQPFAGLQRIPASLYLSNPDPAPTMLTVTKPYKFGTSVSWEGNRRSGVALAMRHRQASKQVYSPKQYYDNINTRC